MVKGKTTIYDNFNELRCLSQGSQDFEQYLAGVQLLVNCCQIQNPEDKELITRNFIVIGANSKTAYRKCVEAGHDASLETILNIYRNKTATQHNFHSIQTPRWKAANGEDSIRGTSGGTDIFTNFHSFYNTFKILRSFRQESWNFEAYVVRVRFLIKECQIQNAVDKELITRNFLVTGVNSKAAYRKCVEAGRDVSLETILNIYRNETVGPQACLDTILNSFRKDTGNSSRRSNSRRGTVGDVTDNSSQRIAMHTSSQ